MAYKTAHNGGKTQLNINFGQFSADFPFMNCLKNSSDPSNGSNGAIDPMQVDANGYGDGSTINRLFWIPRASDRPGNYVAKWRNKGAGSLTLGGLSVSAIIEGSLTSSASTGRCVFTPDDAANEGRIPLNMPNDMYDVVVCHVDDEADIDAGGIFGKKFMERLTEANFGKIRFMDAHNNNTSDVALYSDTGSINHATYTGWEHRRSLAVAAPSGAGSALTCSAPAGFTRANRQKVMFKTGTLGAGPHTIDVGGTGAASICNWQGLIDFPISLSSGQSYCLTWIPEFGMYLAHDGGLISGWPIEICLRLCAELGAHPHFNVPTLAGDGPAGSDYWATGLANAVKAFKTANNCNWMIEEIEGSNETWNFSGGVMQVWFANRAQWMLGGGSINYTSNPTISDGFTVTAYTSPSVSLGAGFVDITLTSNRPSNLSVGTNLNARDFNANGMNNVNDNEHYVAAVDVGGDPKKITCKVLFTPSGTYDGSGAWMVPSQYDYQNWYARTFGKSMQAYIDAYGDSGAGRDVNYRFLIGLQTGYGDPASGGDQHRKFDGVGYVLQGGTAPYLLATHACAANYFNPTDQNTKPEVRKALTYYITQKGNTAAQAATVADYTDTYLNGLTNFNTVISGWKTYLKTKGLKLTFYEGGPSPDYWAEGLPNANTNGPVSIVTGATKASQCVVSLGLLATNGALVTGDSNYKFSGVNGAVAGMQADFFNVAGMTELNSGVVSVNTDGGKPGGLSFTNGSANIGWDSAVAPIPLVGQSVSIDAGRGQEWPFGSSLVKGGMYWVVSRDTTNKLITVSSTKGGSAITVTGNAAGVDIRMHSGWRVLSVDDTGNTITLDCDSTGFTTWTSTPGTPELQRCVYDRGDVMVNVLRYESKYTPTSTLKTNGIGGWLKQNYDDILALNADETPSVFRTEYPSCFTLCCERKEYIRLEHDAQIWAVLRTIFDPTANNAQWKTIVDYNRLTPQGFLRYNKIN